MRVTVEIKFDVAEPLTPRDIAQLATLIQERIICPKIYSQYHQDVAKSWHATVTYVHSDAREE